MKIWPNKILDGLNRGLPSPPLFRFDDHRPVCDVMEKPRVGLYAFNELTFPNTQGPIIRNNPNATMGVNMIPVPVKTWDRTKTYRAGPVRTFFANMLNNRGNIKHA